MTKTLDGFDFNFQPSIDRQVVMNLANLSFIDRKEVAIFIGPPGMGKTHLAIALGFWHMERVILFFLARFVN